MSEQWTTANIPDQRGRVAVVTGANTGLGYETAKALAGHGASVVLAVRDVRKGEQAAARMTGDVSVQALDLTSLDSVRAAAAALRSRFDRIDLLINNAGVMYTPKQTTRDGFEMQFGTNHLGHFALTGLLLDRIGDRVVTLSSQMHRVGKINFDDLQSERKYRRWPAYGQSKLANLIFAFELDRRLRAAGSDVRSVAAHPGYASTNLQTAGPQMSGSKVGVALNRLNNAVVAQSAESGALPTLFAATQDIPSGAYVGPNGPGEMRGTPQLTNGNGRSRDPETARRLWAESERLTGVTFAF
jgi:NAD(P)-dependent dehydrogenase (short-subunit alcohol dehydrogenase family)